LDLIGAGCHSKQASMLAKERQVTAACTALTCQPAPLVEVVELVLTLQTMAIIMHQVWQQ